MVIGLSAVEDTRGLGSGMDYYLVKTADEDVFRKALVTVGIVK